MACSVKPGTTSGRCHRRIMAVLFCIPVALVLGACGPKKEPPRDRPPVPVQVASSRVESVPLQIRAIGNIEASNTVAIKAQVSGVVSRVHFREGQDVQKGDLLFTIDPRPFEASLKQAEAALAKDLAQAKYAQEQVRRYGDLVKDGIVTQDQFDQVRANADANAAAIASDRAAIENARIQLGYCYIRSPISGRTGNLAVNVGNMVKANDVPVLVTINQLSPIYATFSVPERDMVEIRKYLGRGVRVEAFVTGDESKGETGGISFLDNAVDTATGTIKLKGTFANSNRRLWPGQYVNVVITLTTLENSVVVPTQAVQTGQQGQYVFVLKQDQTVEQRPITVGVASGSSTIVTRGLNPGETVVTDGQVRLIPGAKVEVKQGTGSGGQETGKPQGPGTAPLPGGPK